jgi:O-antigen ligase
MLNRSPFVAMALAVAAGTAVHLVSRDARPLGRVVSITFAFIFAGALVLASTDAAFFGKLLITQRFTEEGLQSDRVVAWKNVLVGLLDNLDGGRRIHLGPNAYAHNLWLDVAWTSGIVPFVMLIVFHCAHIPAILRAALGDWPLRDRLVAVGVGCAVLVTCVVEPVNEFSTSYFASTFFLLGVLEGSRRGARARVARGSRLLPADVQPRLRPIGLA